MSFSRIFSKKPKEPVNDKTADDKEKKDPSEPTFGEVSDATLETSTDTLKSKPINSNLITRWEAYGPSMKDHKWFSRFDDELTNNLPELSGLSERQLATELREIGISIKTNKGGLKGYKSFVDVLNIVSTVQEVYVENDPIPRLARAIYQLGLLEDEAPLPDTLPPNISSLHVALNPSTSTTSTRPTVVVQERKNEKEKEKGEKLKESKAKSPRAKEKAQSKVEEEVKEKEKGDKKVNKKEKKEEVTVEPEDPQNDAQNEEKTPTRSESKLKGQIRKARRASMRNLAELGENITALGAKISEAVTPSSSRATTKYGYAHMMDATTGKIQNNALEETSPRGMDLSQLKLDTDAARKRVASMPSSPKHSVSPDIMTTPNVNSSPRDNASSPKSPSSETLILSDDLLDEITQNFKANVDLTRNETTTTTNTVVSKQSPDDFETKSDVVAESVAKLNETISPKSKIDNVANDKALDEALKVLGEIEIEFERESEQAQQSLGSIINDADANPIQPSNREVAEPEITDIVKALDSIFATEDPSTDNH